MVEPSALENLLSKPGPLFEGCGSIQDQSAANSIECPEPLGSTKAGYRDLTFMRTNPQKGAQVGVAMPTNAKVPSNR
jgi:hypothetical protein